MIETKLRSAKGAWASTAALAALLLLSAVGAARAQEILVSVNGHPITSYDVEQRMKLLRLLKKPSSREDALDNLISDTIKLDEVSKFTIHLGDNDIMAQGAQDAKEAKISPAAFAAELQRSGIDPKNWKAHFKAQAEWFLYVRAMNKTLDVSDAAVDAALAKKGEKPGLTQYLVRQVIIVVPDIAKIDSRMPEANEIRSRFDGCGPGVAMARSQPNVVVQPLITRNSTALDDQVRAQLDKTEIGRLTPPQRSAEGIMMIALCGRKTLRDSTAADASIRNELLRDRLKQASDRLYAPLKAHAVIVRFHS